MCSLMLLDETREFLDLRASYGAGDAYIKKPRLAVEESLIGVVVRRKKPLQAAKPPYGVSASSVRVMVNLPGSVSMEISSFPSPAR